MDQILCLVVAVLLIGILITGINVYELKKIHNDHVGLGMPIMEGTDEIQYGPSHSKALWVYGKKVSIGCGTWLVN